MVNLISKLFLSRGKKRVKDIRNEFFNLNILRRICAIIIYVVIHWVQLLITSFPKFPFKTTPKSGDEAVSCL